MILKNVGELLTFLGDLIRLPEEYRLAASPCVWIMW
jgi:hypothetical protein